MEVKAALISSLGRTVLGSDILTIGRDADNRLVIRDPTVSRYHSQIRPDGQGYAIIDLGSVNGTFVNGQRLTSNMPRLLYSGDTFRIGDITFTYEGAVAICVPRISVCPPTLQVRWLYSSCLLGKADETTTD